nr:immunoglobulin light chain junction region [Macaca mulatta]MOW11324.1 immunoglobulin light chain junction region [Macaca mulatta]MOW12290.1 immunoglobulin light chain junction region [Macaca mulatta]
CLRYITSPFTF